jgi:uncharacterized protein (TIGR02453 family)
MPCGSARIIAAVSFEGFPPAAFEWFAGLERDNSRGYFTATRDTYERDVRGALEAMLDELAVEFGGDVRMFRQHRDVRFSPDKSPYKTNTYGLVHGPPGESEAAFYAAVSASGLFAGTGYHELASDQLERFRAAIVDDGPGDALERAVADLEQSGFEVYGEALKTAPRGFPRDHARARLLRHKAMYGGRARPAGAEGITRQAALEHVAGTWRDGRVLNDWLDAHVGPSAIPPEVRFGRGRR